MKVRQLTTIVEIDREVDATYILEADCVASLPTAAGVISMATFVK